MEKKKDRFNKTEKNRWTGLTLSLCLAILFYMAVSNLDAIKGSFNTALAIMASVIIGAVIAFIVNPLAMIFDRRLKKHFTKHQRWSWVISSVAALVLVYALLLGLIVVIAPILVENIKTFVTGIDSYIAQLKALVISLGFSSDIEGKILAFIDEQISVDGVITKYITGPSGAGASNLLNSAKDIGVALMDILIGIIFSFYFLIEKTRLTEILGEFFYLVIPDRHFPKFSNIWHRFNAIFTRYIICELVDAFAVSFVNAIFMLIMGMPYVVLISLIAGLTNLAPTFGPFAGAAINAILLLLVAPEYVIPFLIFTQILQLIDGYLFKPKLFGEALSVPPFLILTFLVVGGNLWGVPGLLIAIPLAAIISYIYDEIFIPWLRERKKAKKNEDNAKPAEEVPAKK
ncbi:MAG: AI-2E family transporter [Saccharofermentans sp.]|nr:AI-2E family transporter [Saccharofermentans sp.]